MIIFLQEFVLQLFLWSLKLVDAIMEMFASLTGIATVTYKGEQHNLLELCLQDPTISSVFWCVFVLGIGLTCMFTIIATVKNMVANNQALSSIVGKFFVSLLGTLAVLSCVILAIMISNSILYLIADMFEVGTEVTLSTAIFDACCGEYLNGYSINEIDINNMSVAQIFGEYNKAAFGIWPKSWKGDGMVNPDSFEYISCILITIALPLALLVASINLAKRLFEIVYMYVVMPIAMSTLPLDEGARFKTWRECLTSKILLAYGTVFSVNIFILLTPILSSISLTGLGDFSNSIFKMLVLIGGALIIPAGQDLFIHLFSVGEEYKAGGGGFVHGFIHGARVTALMPVRTITRTISGTTHYVHNRRVNKERQEKDQKYQERQEELDRRYEESQRRYQERNNNKMEDGK